jgi:hypothetical protein
MSAVRSLKVWLPQLIASLLLLAAMGNNPPEFYWILRWVICGLFAFVAYQAHEQDKMPWVLICSAVSVVYNPFIPFYLGREMWLLANKATIVAAVASAFALSKTQSPPKSEK